MYHSFFISCFRLRRSVAPSSNFSSRNKPHVQAPQVVARHICSAQMHMFPTSVERVFSQWSLLYGSLVALFLFANSPIWIRYSDIILCVCADSSRAMFGSAVFPLRAYMMFSELCSHSPSSNFSSRSKPYVQAPTSQVVASHMYKLPKS